MSTASEVVAENAIRAMGAEPVPFGLADTVLMSTLRIALLQLTAVAGDTPGNLERGIAGCRQAAEGGADIALFPEMWQLGYAPCPNDEAPGFVGSIVLSDVGVSVT